MTPPLAQAAAAAVDDGLLALYRTLHAHPELSGQEAETAERLADALEAAGCTVHRGIGGHGVAAVLEDGTGPTLLVRADMDALPVEEATDLPYASRATGTDPNGNEVPVMHACGHDLHMAALVGFARAMRALRGSWRGRLILIGQPSEERVSGAAAMIAGGLYERVGRPDFAIALHVSPEQSTGTVLFTEGTASAGAESIDLLVRGLGGHAAHPDLARDPVFLAAACVLGFQEIVSRELDPQSFGVLTVAMIHGGVKHNAIPDEVRLGLNIRFFNAEVRARLLDGIERVATGLACAAGVPADRMPVLTLLDESARPLVNDPALVRRVRAAVEAVLGPDRVGSLGPSSGSEDFGAFGAADPPVPLCYFRIGTGGGRLHSPTYAPDPRPALEAGVTAFAAAAIELLKKD
ncbi:MAG: amidohydrolase [Methanospirillum sp.]